MRMKYNEENPPVENLNIYCVSSAAYELNAKGYNDEDIPVSVNATGIPKLRAFMARVAAEEKLNVLQNHCSGHLPSMMSSLESWSLRLTMDRRREMRRVVAKPGESVETVIAALARKIKDQLDDTLLNTLPFDDIAVVPTETFMKSLSPKKVQLRELVDTFSAKGLQSSRDVRLNVITDDTEDAFLLRELGPVYQACAAEAGKGSHAKRCRRLQDALSEGKPFGGMEARVKAAIEGHLDSQIKKLARKVRILFDVVVSDFDGMFMEQERPDAGRDTLRAKVRAYMHKAEATVHGPMAEGLARAITKVLRWWNGLDSHASGLGLDPVGNGFMTSVSIGGISEAELRGTGRHFI
ncbi:MAG: hypothetical protein Q9201_005433 [Fulgogasparrea decipioides]